ncbi:MAG: lysylphosphatidylglycerol synthase transmembrane domain-containing protein [Candidatus Thermoplasmatota archaeon]
MHTASGPGAEAKAPRRRIKLSAVLAAVAVLVLAVALWRSDPREAARELARVPFGHIALVVGLVLLGYALRFAKWHLFLRRLGTAVPLGRSAAIFTSGLLMVVTPAKVGEVWKALALKETDDIPVARGLGAVALERLTDLAAIGALALLGAAALGLAPWLAAGAMVAFAAGVLLLRWRRPWLALLARLEARRPGSRPVAFLHALYLDTASLLSLSTLGLGAAFGLAAWALEGLALWVILDGLGVAASPVWAVGVFAAATLAGGLSILPGGVGTAEAGMVALLVAGDVASSTAFAATLLVRVLTLGFGAALGGACYALWSWRAKSALVR